MKKNRTLVSSLSLSLSLVARKSRISYRHGVAFRNSRQAAFTIVELLIVVVVIAILAAITLIAFNNITSRAKNSAAASAAQQAFKKVAVYAVDNAEQLPPDLATAGITNQNGTTYQYRTYNTNKYCITATANNISSYIDNDTHTTPTAGACDGHGVNGVAAITNLAPNPAGTSNWIIWAGTGGNGSVSRLTGSGTTPSTFSRLTITTATAANEFVGLLTARTDTLVTAGQTYSFRISGRTSRNASVSNYTMETKWYAGTTQVGTTIQTSVPFLGANTWHTISKSGLVAPATADSVVITVLARLSGANAVGDTFDATGLMVEQGAVSHAYGDGNSPGWAWSGTPNSSTSSGPDV